MCDPEFKFEYLALGSCPSLLRFFGSAALALALGAATPARQGWMTRM